MKRTTMTEKQQRENPTKAPERGWESHQRPRLKDATDDEFVTKMLEAMIRHAAGR